MVQKANDVVMACSNQCDCPCGRCERRRIVALKTARKVIVFNPDGTLSDDQTDPRCIIAGPGDHIVPIDAESHVRARKRQQTCPADLYEQ